MRLIWQSQQRFSCFTILPWEGPPNFLNSWEDFSTCILRSKKRQKHFLLLKSSYSTLCLQNTVYKRKQQQVNLCPQCGLGTVWRKTQIVFLHAVLGMKSAIMLGKYVMYFVRELSETVRQKRHRHYIQYPKGILQVVQPF